MSRLALTFSTKTKKEQSVKRKSKTIKIKYCLRYCQVSSNKSLWFFFFLQFFSHHIFCLQWKKAYNEHICYTNDQNKHHSGRTRGVSWTAAKNIQQHCFPTRIVAGNNNNERSNCSSSKILKTIKLIAQKQIVSKQ